MKAYISKYALRADVYDMEGCEEGGFFFPNRSGPLDKGMKLGLDAHLTRDAAIVDAERRRQERIASLEKQLRKLKLLNFK